MNARQSLPVVFFLLLAVLACAPGCTVIRYSDTTTGASVVYGSLGTSRNIGPIRITTDGDKKTVTVGGIATEQTSVATQAIDAAGKLAAPWGGLE